MRVPFAKPVAAGLLLACLAAPAVSASGRASIVIDNNFITGAEYFWSPSGFCPQGTSETSDLKIVGGRGGLTFHLDKTLTCDDGSGSLTIHVDAATAYGHPDQDQGGWSVVGGTGEWAGASGGGRLVGDYVPTGVLDHYTGSLNR